MNNCNACGKYIQEDDRGYRTRPHEIVTRGAGGKVEEENQLVLCVDCHRFFHNAGWKTFIQKFSHLREKVIAAREAGGKKVDI